MKLVLIVTTLFTFGCTDHEKAAELESAKQQINQSLEQLHQFKQDLEKNSEVLELVHDATDPNGETVKMWNDSLSNCEGVETEQCDKLRDAFTELQATISNNAKVMSESNL